jgi:hypothetical protein
VTEELRYRLHARRQMAERAISPQTIEQVLTDGEVIERAHRPGRPFPIRLLLGWVEERPIHVLVADDPGGRHYVITVYEPTPERWSDDFRKRRGHR